MKRIDKLFVATTLVLLSLAVPAVAGAASVFRLDQQIATGIFSSTDPSGCILSQVSVVASRAVMQFPPSSGEASTNGFISISQSDLCSGTPLFVAEGLALIPDQDFQISPTLDSATLNTTINVFDGASSFDVTVNLTWTGTGALARRNFHSHGSLPACKTNLHSNDLFRPAQVSGDVSDGVTNFISGLTGSASLSSGKSGNVDVGCQ